MKKKVLSMLLVGAMTATMFAGCGNSTDNKTEDKGTQASDSGDSAEATSS